VTGHGAAARRLQGVPPPPDQPAGSPVVLPPLTLAEVRLLQSAAQLFRSLVRHAAAYDDAHTALRSPLLDVRAEVVLRFPPQGPDGLFRLPPLTPDEAHFLRLALANLDDGLGHLAAYGPSVPDPGAPGRLLARITAATGQAMGSVSP
jgi:hypothetical protein